MDLKELVLRIKGDSKGAEKALSNVSDGARKFGTVVKTIIAGAAVAAVVSFGKSCIDAAAEAQSAETLLRSSLGNIKGMTDKLKDSAVAWVNEMEVSKGFDDSEISAALQRMIIKTGDLAKAQEITAIAMEVSRNKGIDLASATSLLDTAYNGSARALKQFGVEAREGASGMDYLREIQDKVKGSGDAWAQTLQGQRTIFDTTFGNFKEAVGGTLMPIATKFMETILPYLQKAMSWITEHMPQISSAIKTACDIIGAAFKVVNSIINGFIEAIKWIIDNIKKVSTAVNETFSTEGHVLSGGRYASAGVISPIPHATGGWVGLNGPELSVVGERGPEYIVPNGGESPDSALLRRLIGRVDALIATTERVAPAMAASLNGIGRGS